MKLDKSKIKDEVFSLSSFSKKFRIAKTKTYLKSAIEELGGTIEKSGGKCIIGRETTNFYSAFANNDYIFEGELEDRDYQKDFKHFKNFDLKLYAMIRELLATDNINFTFIRIGVPIKETEFEKFEKKLKRPIPKAVKEFYSIFGEIRILWSHRNPHTKVGRSASNKQWNLDYYDNHIGSFQILPLKTVLFEKWDNEDYCLGVGTDLKIFDTSTTYHMVALDITSEGDPLVYRGEDHGVEFNEASPLLFTEYLDLCLGLYGTRERMEYFQTALNSNNKSDKEIQEAIDGKTTIDINNDAYVLPKIKEITTIIDEAIAKKDYKTAQDRTMDLHGLKQDLFIRYMLDMDRLQEKGDEFARRIGYAIRDTDFDWKGYEKEHKGDPIFESKGYVKAKLKF